MGSRDRRSSKEGAEREVERREGRALRILLVEDSSADAQVILRALAQAGLEVEAERVQTEADLAAALDRDFDVILSDHRLSRLTAAKALAHQKARAPDVPFLVVSASMREAEAIQLLHSGARDYFVKDNLVRLGAAIERELEEADNRRSRRVAEQEREEARDELRENEQRFRQVVEASPHGVLVVDAEGRIVLSNQSGEQIFGFSREELIGQPIDRLVPASVRGRHNEDISAFLQAPENRLMGLGQEIHGRRKDGTLFPVEIGLSHFESAAGQQVLATVVDITDRRLLETQLQQAQKMEAIGRLAGGLAHDFNNVLGVILGLGELGQADLPADDPVQHRLVEIVAAARRATDLTRQMLAFSRQQVMHPRPLDLNAVVGESRDLLAQMIGADVELRLLLDAELGTVRADPTQIAQVLMNLAVNARDAMPSGGTLTFETKNVELDEEYVRIHATGTPGPYVLLAVTDTGHGMDLETRARVFEPFFSTKEEGKGTGLGLATVYGIIKQSGGFVWVYSEPGHGAAFRIYLPQVRDEAQPLDARAADDQAAPTGSETILLVEDQDAVRRMTQELLRRQGYEVLVAASGEEALAIVESHPARIHLVLSDVVMPGTNGRELAERLQGKRADLRVLFMSGYSNGVIRGQGLLDEDVMLIEKPFSAAELGRAVRRALEG